MAARPKRPRDPSQLAKLIVDISTGDAEPDAPITPKQLAGSKGGIKGGLARAAALTPEQRKKIAKKAAKSRWRKPETVD